MRYVLGSFLAAFGGALMLASGAMAQDAGDPQKGLAYARKRCVECHDLAEGGSMPILRRGPAFKDIANSAGMTGTALIVWFRTPHANMPNLIIEPADQRDLAAYIIGLRGKN